MTGKELDESCPVDDPHPGLPGVIPHVIHHVKRAITFVFEVLSSHDCIERP